MLQSAKSLKENDTLQADVCIIGGGAAGITLARELSKTNLNILLLEGGGREYDKEVQALYGGQAAGLYATDPFQPHLTKARLRYWGGSTNHWGGHCARFEQSDFDVRPWVPDSGWPIKRSELDDVYKRACEYAQVSDDFDKPIYTAKRPSIWNPSSDEIAFRRFQLSPPTRFAAAWGPELEKSERVRVLLHANVIELVSNEEGAHVNEVRVGLWQGGTATVKARAFVLAAGGIENARLLLVSKGGNPKGIGNSNDLVGRYLADHLEAIMGAIFVLDPKEIFDPLARLGAGARPMIFASPKAQKAHGLLSAYFQVHKAVPSDELKGLFGPLFDRSSKFDRAPIEGRAGILHSHAEVTPNADSRVTLIDEKDRFGVPRVKGDWQVKDGDMKSLERSLMLIGRVLGARGMGRICVLDRKDKRYEFNAGQHHMGTTRMHSDPKKGVVNADARMHEIDNLYVAGSSIFTTAGSIPPTFSITALSIRLADHLKKGLAS